MRIGSADVEAVKFSVTIRGYAEDEVDAFLDLVVDTITELERRDATSRKEINRLQKALDDCRTGRLADLTSSSRDMSRTAEDRVQAMLDNAAQTSEQIVEEALEACEYVLDRLRTAVGADSVDDQADRDPEVPATAAGDEPGPSTA